MSMQRYNRNRLSRYATGGAVAGSAYQLYAPYVRQYGPQAVRSVSNYVGGVAQRAAGALTRQRNMRTARTEQSRLRGARKAVPTGKQIPSGGGESKSYTTVTNPKMAMGIAKELLAPNLINRNGAGTISTTSGLQAQQLIGSYFDVVDIQNAFNAISQGATGNNSGKIALQSLHSTHLYTNSCSNNTHMTIYDCIARHDGSDTNTSPTNVIQLGGADITGGGVNDYLTPGTSPFNNPRFTSSYKIVKQTPVILSPGQTHVHRVNYQVNKILNKERIVTSDLAGPVGDITMYTFIIIHGTPAHEVAAENTVSLSLAKIDYVFMESFTYRAMLVNSIYGTITNSLPVLTAGEQWTTDNPTDTANAS